MIIYNVYIPAAHEKLEKGNIAIEHGVITDVELLEQNVNPADLGANALIASPGWIDLQINGGFGHDLTTCPERVWDVAAQLPKFGVTGFLPTILSSSADTYKKAIAIYRAGPPKDWQGAHVFGWHFEGPFLNPDKKGAHNPACLRLPEKEFAADWSKENGVALVTMAPELTGAAELASCLCSRGVVLSMGHSMAVLEETRCAIEHGFTAATHLFNAMPALDHRCPGLAGEALVNDAITVGLIADGYHVHGNMVNLAWKLKSPGRLMLVTDAVGALGLPAGEFVQGGMEIVVSEDSARLKDGTLAGSMLRMDQALRNVMGFTGASMGQVLPALGAVQAKLLGLTKNGQIRPGFNADITLVDQSGRLKMTVVGGEVLYRSEEG